MAQWLTNPTRNHEVSGSVAGLAQWVKGSSIAVSWGVGCRHGSDPALLWFWCRPAATAPIRPLAWEPPYAVGGALEKAKRPKKKKIGEGGKRADIIPHCSALLRPLPENDEHLEAHQWHHTGRNREMTVFWISQILYKIDHFKRVSNTPEFSEGKNTSCKDPRWGTKLPRGPLQNKAFHRQLETQARRLFSDLLNKHRLSFCFRVALSPVLSTEETRRALPFGPVQLRKVKNY